MENNTKRGGKADGITRAVSGGQQGVNGDWYEGGKFLPSTGEPKRKARKARGTGKQEIAPFVWAAPPSDDVRAIYPRLCDIFHFNRATCTFGEWTGVQLGWTTDEFRRLEMLRDLFNIGARFAA